MNQEILIHADEFNKARKLIRESHAKYPEKEIIFSGSSDELNRQVLEKENISVLLLSQKGRKDFQKQRNSGLNHVFARLAKKNNVAIGINLDEIIQSTSREKSEVLSRVSQNIEICKKSKLRMKFISRENKIQDSHGLKALGLVLGAPTWMI